MRIGIHTGSCLGGVIGSEMPRFFNYIDLMFMVEIF
jgi:class 3 adenylate cyclase